MARVMFVSEALPILVSIALLCGGCHGEGEGEAHFELGTGARAFEAVEDGQQVELAFGTQQGFHVWLAGRVSGLDPENVLMQYDSEPLEAPEVPDCECDQVSSGTAIRDLHATEMDGVYEFAGVQGRQMYPKCIESLELRVRVILTDDAGVSVVDERVVVPEADPDFRTQPMRTCTAE